MQLANRFILITGAKRIGAVLAAEVARLGADVALSFNSSRREAEEAAAAVRQAGRRAVVIRADLSAPDQGQALVDQVAREFGRLDILVNMASVYRKTPLEDVTDQTWRSGMAVDLDAASSCARAAARHMRAAGGGRIVNIADWLPASGRPRYTGFLPYYVAKAGIIALTEALALELAPDGILVNAVAPGPILPPPDVTPDEIKAVEDATPLGRWGGEQEIVKAILFLIDTEFVTGEVIRVDGGRHLR